MYPIEVFSILEKGVRNSDSEFFKIKILDALILYRRMKDIKFRCLLEQLSSDKEILDRLCMSYRVSSKLSRKLSNSQLGNANYRILRMFSNSDL